MTDPSPTPGNDEQTNPPLSPPPVKATRAGRVWVAIILGLIVLAVLLVFIFQNLHQTTIHFFTLSGSLSVALALLIAACGGAIVVLAVGSIRIIQLRRGVRRSYSEGAEHSRRGASPEPPTTPTEALPEADREAKA